MKMNKLIKLTSIIIATALMITSVLFYIDKKSVKASQKTINTSNTVDNKIDKAIENIEESNVKGNSTTYTMTIDGKKVTYKVTNTTNGRKVVQTNNKTNEYTELIMNDKGLMSVTTGEVKDGKYIAKSLAKCDVNEESEKVEEENQSTSNRVSCLALGNSLWYEKNDSSVNIGKSRSGKDIESKAIELTSLEKNDVKNVEAYQRLVDKSSKNWAKAQENLPEIIDNLTYASICGVVCYIAAHIPFIASVLEISAIVVAVYLIFTNIPTLVNITKAIANSTKGLYYAIKAKKEYNKIVSLGIDY